MSKRYKAALFAPDGAWVTDYRDCATIEEAWERIDDRGSRWFFYPFPVVIVDHGALTTDMQRVVQATEPFEDMKGRTLRTYGRMLADLPLDTLAAILG